jgi:hypothetical protein
MSVLRNNRIRMPLCALLLTLGVAVWDGLPARGNTANTAVPPSHPPDPDNAALLYYQAFLSCPKADEPVDTQLRDYADGKIELNKAIEDYVGSCRGAIGLAVVASELRECDWGLRYSEGFSMILAHLAQMRTLGRILIADARVMASRGEYAEALTRCVTVLKISRHVGDQTVISTLVGWALEGTTYGCIQDLLGRMPGDRRGGKGYLKTLEQLRADLAALSKKPLSLKNSLEIEREVVLEQIKMEKVPDLLKDLDPNRSPEESMKLITEYGGEAFLELCRGHYSKFMTSVMSIIESDASYAEARRRITKVIEQVDKDQKGKKNEAMFTTALVPALSKLYGLMIKATTHANAVRAAVELYIAKGKTGRLPETLPAGLPKDLFSGKDFEYIKTMEGFVLRCQAKDIDKDKIHEYEFKVPK